MQRIKLLGLLIVAVLAVAAVSSASASAEACHKSAGSKTWALCVGGESIGSPTKEEKLPLVFHIKTGAGAHVADHELGTPGIVFTCTSASGEGSWDSTASEGIALGMRNISLSLKSCSFEEGSASCKIEGGAVNLTNLGGAIGSSAEDITLSQQNEERGGLFAQFKIPQTGSCTLWGTWRIFDEERKAGKGPQCTIKEVETERAEQQIVCEGSKSHLVAANGNAVQFSVEEVVELAGAKKGQKFSIIEGT